MSAIFVSLNARMLIPFLVGKWVLADSPCWVTRLSGDGMAYNDQTEGSPNRELNLTLRALGASELSCLLVDIMRLGGSAEEIGKPTGLATHDVLDT